MKNWLAKLKPSSGASTTDTPDGAASDDVLGDDLAGGDGAGGTFSGGTPEPADVPKRARKASVKRRSRGNLAPVLGLHVTPQTIYGLLMRREGDGFEVVRRVTRKRAADGDDLGSSAEELLADVATDDVAIQFGDAGINTGSDIFMGSEFGSLGADVDLEGDGMALPLSTAQPIVLELKDLIEECQSGSFESPKLAFCLDASDVTYTELRVESPAKGKGLFNFGKGDAGAAEAADDAKAAKKTESVKRETLLELLPDTLRAATHDTDRIAFLPMTPRDGAARFLAVAPDPSDPVTPSAELLREQDGMRNVRMTLLSAEIPALIGLTRQVFPMGEAGNTAIVRVGSEDTLVMLLVGDTLHHAEHMRSVTTFDGPDTICSRVLLQQDVQGVGDVHQVIVLAEEREEELVTGFSAFYPGAHVTTLRAGLVEGGWLGSKAAAQRPISTMLIPAASVALETFYKGDESGFAGVNLFPKSVMRQRMKFEWLSTLGFAWHTILAAAIVFVSVLFFTSLYFKNEAQKANLQRQIDTYPAANMSPEQVQFKIDSLNAEVVRVNATLNAIDSLLVGSDRWSKGLARTARAVASARQGWVNSWSVEGGNLVMDGRAVSRAGVVQFADRMGGSIESVRFSEVRGFPAYDFEIRTGMPVEMPDVALYLRENAQGYEREAVPVAEPLSGFVEAPISDASSAAPPAAQAPAPAAAPAGNPSAAPANASAEALFQEEAPPEGFVVPELAIR